MNVNIIHFSNEIIIYPIKEVEVHEDRLHGERRRGLTPFILLPRTLHLPAPPLLAPRCAAKARRLRRRASLRRPAPWSLVVSGGGREVRRARKEKNGASWSPVLFTQLSDIKHHLKRKDTTNTQFIIFDN